MALNSWGTVTLENRERSVQNTEKYKPERIFIANKVKELLNSMNPNPIWFIEAGTLMGAFRNGKMIPHDDDFDMGVLGDDNELDRIYNFFKDNIKEPYKIRKITTYCKKIEVYNPESGVFNLTETENYHNVSLDLTLFIDMKTHVQQQYFKNETCDFKYDLESIIPTKEIEYEGYMFKCPNDPEKFLTSAYGYIGPNAIFDFETGKYKLNIK